MVVKEKRDLTKILLHYNFKADYGPCVALDNDGKLVGVTKEDEIHRKSLGSIPTKRRQVITNDSTLAINYEVWVTKPMCSKTQAWREPLTIFKDPITGLKTLRFREDEIVQFEKHFGLIREFRTEGWILAAEYCDFEKPFPSSYRSTGVFYTDPRGKELRETHGPDSLYQFIEPDFSLRIDGLYEPTDPWHGLFKDGASGRFNNICNGIVRNRN